MRIETTLPIGASGWSGDLASVQEQAQKAEELGYDGIVATETKGDPFVPLILAASATSRITLATGVAIAFPRSPMTVAMTAWDLQRLSGGRFSLGLGTQVKGHIERRYSTPWAPPGPRLREYVLSLRAIWDCWQNGTPLKFEGEYYNFSLMPPDFNPGPIEHPHIPVVIGAVNQYNCRLAGEICDGIRTHPLISRKYLEDFILPNVEEGARRAGRSVESVQVYVSPLIATGRTDAEVSVAAEDVRRRIAFYASTRSYRPVLEIHGWGSTVDTLHRLSVRGEWDKMPQQITDEMLETFAIVGTYDQLAGQLKKRFADLASWVAFGIPVDDDASEGTLKSALAELRSGSRQ